MRKEFLVEWRMRKLIYRSRYFVIIKMVNLYIFVGKITDLDILIMGYSFGYLSG